MPLTCAFTGHRSNRFAFTYNESHPLCVQIKEALIHECRRLYETENVGTFYTGCALGVDMWGAEAVLQLRCDYPDIALICAVPFPGHTEKWIDNQKQRLAAITQAATETVYTCERYSAEAYKTRNYYMVDRAQFLIAVFDGEKNLRSGTKQTVNYAIKKKLSITLIHPDTAAIAQI